MTRGEMTADRAEAETPVVGDEPSGPSAPPRPELSKTATRAALSIVALVALVASALVGGNAFGLRDRMFGTAAPKAAQPAVSRDVTTLAPGTGSAPAGSAGTAAPAATALRSQPWWQGVTTLQGTGSLTAPAFSVVASAIQWRARWTCQVGHLTVRAPGRVKPVVDAGCPATGTGYAGETGVQSVQVTADGTWQVQVDQMVDVPLVEPPLPAMSAPGARAVLRGPFYNIDQSSSGQVTIYQLADHTYTLRLDGFYVSPNTDLEIRFSPLRAPHSTGEYTSSSPSDLVAPLDITAGSLNFAVPTGIDPTGYHSLVIWCPNIQSAYAAATLAPAA